MIQFSNLSDEEIIKFIDSQSNASADPKNIAKEISIGNISLLFVWGVDACCEPKILLNSIFDYVIVGFSTFKIKNNIKYFYELSYLKHSEVFKSLEEDDYRKINSLLESQASISHKIIKFMHVSNIPTIIKFIEKCKNLELFE